MKNKIYVFTFAVFAFFAYKNRKKLTGGKIPDGCYVNISENGRIDITPGFICENRSIHPWTMWLGQEFQNNLRTNVDFSWDNLFEISRGQ